MTRPDTYTHGHAPRVLAAHGWRTAANSAAYLLPLLHPGLDLLDVGCGPGTITVDLARLVAPGRVTGVDREEAPLAGARATAEAAGVRVEFRTGDVYGLDAADASYDVVHAHQVLQHLSDPVAALAEMRRVTRPGGVVAVRDADYGAFVWHPAEPRLSVWLDLYHQVARGNGAEPDAGRRLRSWALAAGFPAGSLTATASSWVYASTEERAWWGGLWADRVTATAFAEQATAGGHATRAELRELAAGWRAWAEAPDGWLMIPSGELLCRV